MVKAARVKLVGVKQIGGGLLLPWFAVMLQPVKRRPMPVPSGTAYWRAGIRTRYPASARCLEEVFPIGLKGDSSNL